MSANNYVKAVRYRGRRAENGNPLPDKIEGQFVFCFDDTIEADRKTAQEYATAAADARVSIFRPCAGITHLPVIGQEQTAN